VTHEGLIELLYEGLSASPGTSTLRGLEECLTWQPLKGLFKIAISKSEI
jgi:hypothetical protein